MKKLILWIVFFSGFLATAGTPEVEKLVEKAEKMMLLNPKASFQIAQTTYKNKSPDQNHKLRLLFIMMNTSNILQKPLDVIKYGNEALAIKSDDVVTRIKVLGILGNSYQSLKLNEKTRIYLDQAELLLSSKKIPDSVSYIRGNIYYLKAMNYFNSLDSDIALSYFDKAITHYISSRHPVAEINLKLAYLNKGFTLIEQKRLNQARENLQLARINTDGIARPYPQQFVQLQNEFIDLGLAKIQSIEKNPDLSTEMLLKILERRKNSAIRDDIENDVYQILGENYLQKKDIKKHAYYQKLYAKRIAETNFDAERQVNLLIAQEKTFNISEKKIILNKYTYGIIFSLLFFLTFITFLLLKYHQVRQKRNLIEKQVFDNL